MMGLGAGAASVNVNEQLIRPVFQYSMVIFLIVLPMITMRTYSEEKRSGTMELLLTSPLTDLQIIMGKFIGAMGLYAAMLGGHAAPHGLLFWVRQPGVDADRDRPTLVCCSWAAASCPSAC